MPAGEKKNPWRLPKRGKGSRNVQLRRTTMGEIFRWGSCSAHFPSTRGKEEKKPLTAFCLGGGKRKRKGVIELVEPPKRGGGETTPLQRGKKKENVDQVVIVRRGGGKDLKPQFEGIERVRRGHFFDRAYKSSEQLRRKPPFQLAHWRGESWAFLHAGTEGKTGGW